MWVVYFNHSDNGGGYADMILDSDLGSNNLVDWKNRVDFFENIMVQKITRTNQNKEKDSNHHINWHNNFHKKSPTPVFNYLLVIATNIPRPFLKLNSMFLLVVILRVMIQV